MANTMRIGFRLKNFEEFRSMLIALPPAVERKVVGVALEGASRPIKRRAKVGAPKRTGALRNSITHVLRQYRKKTVVVIGPDRAYYEGGKRQKRGGSNRGLDRPANYAHLVEFGHRTRSAPNASEKKLLKFTAKERKAAIEAGRALPAAGRRRVDFVPARPFLRPAVVGGEREAAQAFEQGMAKGLEREIKKLNRKIIKQRGQAA